MNDTQDPDPKAKYAFTVILRQVRSHTGPVAGCHPSLLPVPDDEPPDVHQLVQPTREFNHVSYSNKPLAASFISQNEYKSDKKVQVEFESVQDKQSKATENSFK